LDDSFAALVRGPSTTYPRGFPLLFPTWFAVVFGGVWFAWLKVIGPMQWWYAETLAGGLLIAGLTVAGVFATIRQPAFRADRNGIRLGLRTERKRPRNRQAHLWWSDVRQLRIEPRRYGVLVEVSLGPAARIVRRRGPARQALLWVGTLVMPFGLGRGTPRLTEPRRKDPQYRVRLYDVTPEGLGLALAGLALPAVEIIVISRRYGPIMARRPQPAAPRRPEAPPLPAAAPLAKAPRMGPSPAPAPPPTLTAPPLAATAPSEPLQASEPAEAEPSTAETPIAPAPAAEVPATLAPAAETPAAETPAAEVPAIETPAAETPAAEAPASETPDAEARPDDACTDGTAPDDTRPDGVPVADGSLAEVPVIAGPHAGLEAATDTERQAAQPAA
jgi:hypothetical protein